MRGDSTYLRFLVHPLFDRSLPDCNAIRSEEPIIIYPDGFGQSDGELSAAVQPFPDRRSGGCALASKLEAFRDRDDTASHWLLGSSEVENASRSSSAVGNNSPRGRIRSSTARWEHLSCCWFPLENKPVWPI
jgi:hypothetical protein